MPLANALGKIRRTASLSAYRLLQFGPDQTRPPALQIDNGRVVVGTSATASLPAGLISVMGFTRLDIEAAAQAVRRDLDLALDASTSLAPAPISILATLWWPPLDCGSQWGETGLGNDFIDRIERVNDGATKVRRTAQGARHR
jgi:hypothetical protein